MGLLRALVRSPASSIEEGVKSIIVEDRAENGHESKEPLGDGMLKLDVRACCVNYPDLMQLTNSYQHKQSFPYTPGLEVAGVVADMGSGCTRFKRGDCVISWASGGGMCSEMVVDQGMCLPMPDSLDFCQAAAFRIGYETAYHSLIERGAIKSNDIVLVNGATGGMGFAAVQIAKQVFGCTVIATGGADTKLGVVQKVGGANHVINYTSTPNFSSRIKELTGGKGVDLMFDCVGGSVFDQGLRSTAFGARVLIVGFTSGVRPKIPANYALIKCLSVLGCRAGEMPRREADGGKKTLDKRYQKLLNYAADKGLKPHVSHTYPLTTEGVQQAFAAVLERQVVGRVCLAIEPSNKL